MQSSDTIATLPSKLSHLERLQSKAIHFMLEAVAEARNPVLLFSAGKDSTVMAHLALQAFYPGKPPFPLLHIDSTREFQSLLDFRDDFASEHGLEQIVRANEEVRAAGLHPFDHVERYTAAMRTDAPRQGKRAVMCRLRLASRARRHGGGG